MLWELKTKKSAGVPVTKRVHRLIQQANSERDAGSWEAAAAFYEEALAREPHLYHIWMQLAHAHKAIRDFANAELAYRNAAKLKPECGEPYLHLGHLYKIERKGEMAGRAYSRAVQLDPGDPDAIIELHRQLQQPAGPSREKILDLLHRAWAVSRVSDEPAPGANPRSIMYVGGSGGCEGPVIFFDVSDLVGYYSQARLPTGIQRVQIETISQVLSSGGNAVRICSVFGGCDEWLNVPHTEFRDVVELSLQSGSLSDPAWRKALSRLYLALAIAEPLQFPDSAHLVNLGTSWWQHNYFLQLREAQGAHNIRYIPLIFDLIPVIMPEYCLPSVVDNFVTWLVGVFDHAAGFLVISQATKRDLLRAAAELGYALDPALIEVVPLDADFSRPTTTAMGPHALSKWGLSEHDFVLFVSTIEPRKGHEVAFEAWLRLIERYGVNRVPRLVCVGSKGWSNDRIYQLLASRNELASSVTILSGLSDDELALLYRSCTFTIYPSLYEGWGLPITEALCYGKPVIASDCSSLPEAGGPFARYVEAGSSEKLADEVERMHFDTAYRRLIEGRIAQEFQPRSWRDVVAQIHGCVTRLTVSPTRRMGQAPFASIGVYHCVGRLAQLPLRPELRSGERFRTGTGWLWPDASGCWARPGGGELEIGVPADHGPLRAYFHICAPPQRTCHWRLIVDGTCELEGILPAGEHRWVAFDYTPLGGGGAMHLRLQGEPEQIISVKRGDFNIGAAVSIKARGFFLHGRNDVAAREQFLETVVLNAVADLNEDQRGVAARAEDRH